MNRLRLTQAILVCLAMTATTTWTAVSPAAQNTLTTAEKQSGWTLLFDGQSLDHWRNYRKDEVSDGWKIVDDAITWTRKGAGDLITKQEFDSFELVLEYKISEAGNSGLMFHVTEELPAPWQTGPEIQIQDNVKGHDPQKAGWVYQLYPAEMDATRPAGEWNQLRIRITPEQCIVYMNGVRYSRFQKGSADWDKRVAASKFAKYEQFGKPTKGHIVLQDHGNEVAFRNIKIREIRPGEDYDPVDGTAKLQPAVAFPKLTWAGWEPINEQGKSIPLRPIVLTHAGDGSNRIFVATQRGVVHVFPNRPDVEKTEIFLDLQDRVSYDDKQNEEGLLGLAFHPKFAENGQLFIYYTSKHAPHTSIISRFQVKANDSAAADPASEQEIMRIEQPFWNHNGGTIAFGPDGYLYVALGDGGAGNDPLGNGQNPLTLLGSILRIDIDSKQGGRAYSIPADNPFAEAPAKGAPEVWAYGFRNIWRMAFDRQTGLLWAGDVGQDLWEEINIIERGGNYGWNLREGKHMFGPNGSEARKDLIEPVWEYDHQVGRSITGGCVYRGKKLPEISGAYIYADYVSGKLWALKFDHEKREPIANLSIPSQKTPVISFGEDEQGEIYFLTVTANGQGIYQFEKTGK